MLLLAGAVSALLLLVGGAVAYATIGPGIGTLLGASTSTKGETGDVTEDEM